MGHFPYGSKKQKAAQALADSVAHMAEEVRVEPIKRHDGSFSRWAVFGLVHGRWGEYSTGLDAFVGLDRRGLN